VSIFKSIWVTTEIDMWLLFNYHISSPSLL
jgi:hypothetical protein